MTEESREWLEAQDFRLNRLKGEGKDAGQERERVEKALYEAAEESERVEIDRSEFFSSIHDQISELGTQVLRFQIRGMQLGDMLKKVSEMERLGFRVNFYREESEEQSVIGYTVSKKKVGFGR